MQNADVTLTFAMLDMQMANQEYQLEETSPGIYSQLVVGVRDGRPLGADVQRDAEAGAPVQRDHRGSGERMNVRIRLLASLVALAAGTVAVVLVILLLRTIFA